MLRKIPGYEGLYKLSRKGEVFSYHLRGNKIGKVAIRPKILKQRLQNSGYLFVSLYRRTKAKNMLVHRLVAKEFVPNPKNEKYVNHKDGNKQNNIASNLEWVSFSENMQHAWDHGLARSSPAKRANAKRLGMSNRRYAWEVIEKIRNSYKSGVLQKDLAREYGMDFRVISSIVRHKTYRERV